MTPDRPPATGATKTPPSTRAGPDPLPEGDPARPAPRPIDPLQGEAGQWRRLPSGADWMDDAQWGGGGVPGGPVV